MGKWFALCATLVALSGCAVTTPPPVDSDFASQSASKVMTSALSSPDEVIRAHAVEAIGQSMGSRGADYVLRALSDPHPLVRFAAAMSAGDLRIAQAKPRLLELVSDPDASVQIGSIYALHRIGDVRFSKGLEQALHSNRPEVRANAALALGRLGEPTAKRILKQPLKDTSVEVRLQAAEALWRLGQQQGLEYLVAASISQHPAHQMVALMGIAGRRDPSVAGHVRIGLESDYVEVKLVAARALGILGEQDGYALAMESLRSPESRQRYLAAMALGAIGRAEARDALAGLLNDANPDVRLAAASALVQLSPAA